MTIKSRLSKDVSGFEKKWQGGKEAFNSFRDKVRNNLTAIGMSVMVGQAVGGLGLAVYGGMTGNTEAVHTGAVMAGAAIPEMLGVGFGLSVLQDKLTASKSRE